MNSKELRVRAWESLKGKYWTAFGATIVTGLLFLPSGLFQSISSALSGVIETAFDSGVAINDTMLLGAAAIGVPAVVFSILAFLCGVFVNYAATIGCCGFFVKNTQESPAVSEVFSGFKTKYGRNIGIMLLLEVKLILWTLLFIIPGLIKSFEYAIVPYILADDAEISSKDAFKKAKAMMTGNKWRLFKLNFSFIGWVLLSVLTFGIGAFFLVPYMDAANAEFYVELKKKQQ